MRAGAARWLGCCAVVAWTAGCAAATGGTGAGEHSSALRRVLPSFDGPPEYVAGATVWSGNGSLRPPLQIADSILTAWGWSMALADAAGTMSTEWAYFSTAAGGPAPPCGPDRLGAVRFVLDPEDGGRTLGLRAEAQFAPGADHERGIGFARSALSAFHEATQDAVDFRPPPGHSSPNSAPTPRPLPWPGYAAVGVVACGQAGQTH